MCNGKKLKHIYFLNISVTNNLCNQTILSSSSFFLTFRTMAEAEPSILVTYFSNSTFSKWIVDPTKIHSSKFIKACDNNVIVVFINIDTDSIIGVAILAGKMVEHHPLDVDIYTGTDAEYNRYEAPIKHLHLLKNPLHFSNVKLLCRIPNTYNGLTNICKKTPCSYSRVFLKPKEGIVSQTESDAILHSYTTLIKSLL